MAPSAATANPVSAPQGADANADRTKDKPHSAGARSVQLVLERSFPPSVEEVAADEAPRTKKRFAYAVTARRLAKIALGVALVIAFGWAPLRAMLATTSVEAIINARIETIRSPLEGIVQARD